MDDLTVSVAMATYNGERFLQEQLDSLARQTLPPYELVACDDGSTDGTLDILRQFAAKAPFPVRICQNETRLGFGFNFLGALARCTGDFVAFCDQDDIWKERKLRVCAEAMNDPRVVLVSHSALVMSSQPLPRRMKHPDHRRSFARSCRDLPIHGGIPGFSMVLRRNVLRKVPPPLYAAEQARWAVHDLWAVAAALSCGQIALLPDELALYRLHDRNVAMRAPVTGLNRLAPEPATIERGAEIKEGKAQFLRYAVSFCSGSVRRSFYEYIRQLERIGQVYSDRAQLHRACGHRSAAIPALARMIARLDYGPRALGAKALARDALLATLWPPFRRPEGGALSDPQGRADG